MHTRSLLPVAAACGIVCLFPTTGRADPVRFNRDVRPILSDHCYQCHGPDAARRKADLRLDREADARHVLAGKAGESELVRRITATDPEERMPPHKASRDLSAAQIDILRRWVAHGAKWEQHWAFLRPERPEPPTVTDMKWSRTPIDRFILARMEQAGLRPSPEAGRETLIRRMSFDLTGLPPTPEEVDGFVRDAAPDAVEKLADRLLASPRYGERMAWRWLDASRYADTNGYQTDAERDMWRWRDWVIVAYNRNLPFDRFTIEQLAGDLLPSPTLDQRIATGFNRNHRGNAEGGIVPEEYAVEYVADRVETTSTVWLGLTLGCARCHDHKFDPFTQKEFYRLFAFFNNVPEKGRAVKFGNSPPYIKAPTPEQARRLDELTSRVRELEEVSKRSRPAEDAAQARWETSVNAAELPAWAPDRGLIGHLSCDDLHRFAVRDGPASFTTGRVGWALDFDSKTFADAGNIGDFGFDDRFSLSVWVRPRKPDGAILSRMTDEPRGDGYSVHLVNGKVQVHLTKRWLDDALRVETKETLALDRWHHVVVTYDGSRLAAGTKVYVDGTDVKTTTLLDELNQSFQTKEPLRIGSGGGKEGRFDGLIDDVRVYAHILQPSEAMVLSAAATPGEIVATPTAARTPAEAAKLRTFFLEHAGPAAMRNQHEALRIARETHKKFADAIPTVMVMEEMPTPRDAYLLVRGQYDRRGDKVSVGTPASLPPMSATPKTTNRLDLAQWLVSPENPLTARVTVNRIWQLHFGTGLVKTGEDFGTQGEYPSHPELLDWLATELVRTGWDLKRMHKLIVTSAVYRQSSRVSTESRSSADPENRLLSRFPRYRLSAEMIRDQALFASGLLVGQPGGPSVKPYQPPGLWNELSGAGDYEPDSGDKLYRRGLYTFWKRTVPPPGLAAFDAFARETCWVRETRTNTPLQALNLLNDVTYVESARVLAERVLRESRSPDERLMLAFQRVTSRTPTDGEMYVLRRNLDRHLTEYRKDAAAARKLLTVGEVKPDVKLDPAELAAYAAVCRLILNLDEAVTKE
jgi:Protein of unknown function (DUF1553)/Protein of unknown function (DUF1549)/Concanavalin A-like lectin/glucanases superfamily/Planctomycete cytochrome C